MRLNSSLELDSKDWQILEALQTDARQSLTALGKRVGLSQPAISERVSKLEDAGVIEGYSARINLAKLGIGLKAIIRLKTTHQQIKACIQQFEHMPEVLEVDRVTGEDCFVIHCAIAKPENLERVVDQLAKFGAVTTMLVLSKPLQKLIRHDILGDV
jgi:Lrp/AsnC family transcriptional regulator, leucine-responsive regulatory protein